MCVVSMIMDHYDEKWKPMISLPPLQPGFMHTPNLSLEEINEFRNLVNEFKKDMVEMKKLLERAKEYDRKMNQPDCEMDQKKQKLKELGKLMGVEIDFL